MVSLAFRVYIAPSAQQLVGVMFPERGGDAVLSRRWSLDSLGLCTSSDTPDRRDLPFGTITVPGTSGVPKRSALVQGGFSVTVNYSGERVSITPYTSIGNPVSDYSISYTFDSLGVSDCRTSRIQQAKSKATLRASLEPSPVIDTTWPP